MHINERDQVNYHGFLRAIREMQGVSQETAAKGVCTVSGMNRFENGNRNAEKLMRDRLTARLGISAEKYEDYLQPREYVRWEQRLRIVNAIEKRDFDLAKEELLSYESLDKLNRVNYQFIEAMRFNMLALENAPAEEQYECIKRAVKRTMPNVKKALAGGHLLADQEINLLAEQIRLCPAPAAIADEKEWRISEYEKLINYMENSSWEKLLKAKVYPKVTYYIIKNVLEKDSPEEEIRHGLKLCHTAIELLRDCSRLYYFIEITEARRALASRLMQYGISTEEKEELEHMLQENNEWEQVFKGLYEEYKVDAYMSDFCYLYYENESHNMVEVIETRRNMLGISRVRLSDGICSDRSIVRFEREGNNPCIEMVRCLFERLGMCAEYRRAPVIVRDGETLSLYTKLLESVNGLRNDEADEILAQLKEKLCMNIPYNLQELKRFENILAFKKKEITREQLNERAVEVLEITLPLKAVEAGLNKKKSYITRSELTCIYDIAFYGKGEKSGIAKEYIDNEGNCLLKEGLNKGRISEYELLLSNLASKMGDEGNYQESDYISNCILKECLSNRRMHDLSDSYYNKLWNYSKTAYNLAGYKEYTVKELEKCIVLSQIRKAEGWVAFFQDKIAKLSD